MRPLARLRLKRARKAIATLICGTVALGLTGALRAEQPAPAEASVVARELEQDVIFRALVEELQRSTAELRLVGLAKPYFIEYAAQDVRTAFATAAFGALTGSGQRAMRPLRVDIRVGSYELDNTNFRDGFSFGGGALPIEDDAIAIRQALWWATDRAYKQVAENYARKLAFMEQKIIEDKPDDFSREDPVVAFEAREAIALPLADWEKLAVAASAVFREFPDIQDCGVHIEGGAGSAYLVNSEGTRLRESGSSFELEVRAMVQADDGMELGDGFNVVVEDLAELPGQTELAARCRELAQRLIRLKSAPRLEEAYTGPVLFDAEPATAIFALQFARQLAGGQRPVGAQSDPDDFEKKIGKRILPRSVTVVDDPTRKRLGDKVVAANYRFDQQGVPARPVTLVEGGKLQRLVMSRNPSRLFNQSTGHAGGFYRPTAMTACLIVSSDDAVGSDELRAELLEAAADEGLEFGLRIASYGLGGPLEIYKVFPDGREELVRGADNVAINLRAFKRILAVGDAPFVRNISGRETTQTVAVPALVFEELDVVPVDRDFDKPPLLPSPLARKNAD